jgi:hypothetical protein
MAVRSGDGLHGAACLLGGVLVVVALGAPACRRPTQVCP